MSLESAISFGTGKPLRRNRLSHEQFKRITIKRKTIHRIILDDSNRPRSRRFGPQRTGQGFAKRRAGEGASQIY